MNGEISNQRIGRARIPPQRGLSAHPGFLLPLATIFFTGCELERPHSILDPAGPAAEPIASLGWQMFWVYGLVFAATMALLALALLVPRRDGSLLGSRFVFMTGVAIPTVILVGMLVLTLQVTARLHPGNEDLRVQVISHHWWFEVQYPDYEVVDANEIHVPTGGMVRFELISAGVIHSFWVPRLGGKRDMLPDHFNELYLQADHPGVYHGTCTEYCAGVHALMGFRLVAHEPEDFVRWRKQAAKAPPDPTEPHLVRGREVFMSAGCAGCHAIKGTARGRMGPDLTLVGSRHTLGAGTIANTAENLATWIVDSQAIKPGNMMPDIPLEPDELDVLVDFLRSLP